MKMTSPGRFFVLTLALTICRALCPNTSSAQATTGTPPFGSFGGGPDIINLANLNSHIDIPVLHKAGRGTNFTYDLSYDSAVWYPVGASGAQNWQPVSNWGWRAITEAATGYVTSKLHTQYCGNPNPPPSTIRSYYNDTYVYHDAFGSPHPFNLTVQSQLCGGGGETALAQDGSGYTITFNAYGDGSFWVTSSAGTVIIPAQTGAASKTDRNGNVFSVNGSGQFFDTLSSTTPVLTVAGSGTPTSPLTYTYTPPSGTPTAYNMSFKTYTVQTNFACGGIAEYGPTSNSLVDRITLPDGSYYQFNYEPTQGASANVTGRLTSVTYPTGGTISYIYPTWTDSHGSHNGGVWCTDGSFQAYQRVTPDGTWN
jgi:hypothetical protein